MKGGQLGRADVWKEEGLEQTAGLEETATRREGAGAGGGQLSRGEAEHEAPGGWEEVMAAGGGPRVSP